ncbi:hypothetical protein [Mesorhizobium sp.]|uniref:hypothetical protein n=1 Tax=Mesorhizobium sp. TaxID=1871066 RepID=UPI000FE46C47|nr:hypothetical protein [Mesorhizobium sp.]RWO81543.1 MAG: hypothetical protein EOQ96_24775 [Mesorhizobium sp.]
MILAGSAMVSHPASAYVESRTAGRLENGRVQAVSAFTAVPLREEDNEFRPWSVPTGSTYKPQIVQSREPFYVPTDRITGRATTLFATFEFIDSNTRNPLDAVYEIEASKWMEIEHNIARWRKLSFGWDGISAVPPKASTLDAMKDFVSKIRQLEISPPSTMIASDGEVTLHWDSEPGYAHISFLSDGYIVGIVRRKGQAAIEFDVPSSGYQITSQLYSALKALA